MKNTLRLFVLLVFLLGVFTLSAQTPFSRGVNLTNWFQAGSARQIQFSRYTKEDFKRIKNLGCDVIRLPINLHSMTLGDPDYTLDPLFLHLLDQAVDWAEELQIHLLLDNHTFDPNANTLPSVEGVLLKIWPQMAEHYKDRSNYLYYEVLNEPHGITTALWSQIQLKVINAIRAIDTKHTIIVGASSYNSYNELKNMPVYADTNLIYTFHFYDPFLFTHQGATWTEHMQDLKDIPFPYEAARMPAVPASVKGTWVEGSLNYSYRTDGTVAKVKQLIDVAVAFKTARKVNIFCGEFGVYIPNSPHADRVYWYEVVRKYLEEKGISWTTWDYQGGFGLFEKGTSELYDYDLDTAILKSLNFNIPEQKEFTMIPESKPFDIYTDYIGQSVYGSGNAGTGIIDFYSADQPQAGNYALYWTGAPQYAGPGFDFAPNKDLSQLVANNYELEFWIKGDSPSTRFEIRFVDTKSEVAGDHPWRIAYTIDGTKVKWDGTWQHVKIPLKSFRETGSWDGAWYSAAGKYDWTAVDRLEFISEFGVMGTQKVWLDDIKINGTPLFSKEELIRKGGFSAVAYPNPMNETTTIQYHLAGAAPVKVEIYNLAGSMVASLVNERQGAGMHKVSWDKGQSGVKSGMYICRISSGGKSTAIKIAVNQ